MKLFLALAACCLTVTWAQDKNLVELALELGATRLVSYLEQAGLNDTIAEGGPFTVFGPTNEAFDNLPQDIQDAIESDPELLAAVLQYHVIEGSVASGDLTNELLVDTLETGQQIRINIYMKDDQTIVTATGRQVILADQQATNGYIHVVDSVLLAPEGTVTNYVANNANFSTLLAAVIAADLGDVLDGPGPFTVFAPTNEAFAKIPDEDLNDLLADKEKLTQVLLFHVGGATIYSAGLSDGDNITTLQGQSLDVSIQDGMVDISGSGVVLADEAVTNGVIHAVDTVLMPDNLVQLATNLGATTLVELLEKANLDTVIANDGPFTVFGPTNEAFDALPQDIKDKIEEDEDFLASVLKYHVVNGAVASGDLENELLVDTLENGTQIRINIYTKEEETIITSTGSPVALADQNALNGVIHVVSQVMLPPEGTVTDAVASTPTLSTLLELVTAADLGDTLAGEGPFTVFAPNDAAFAKLPDDVTNDLINNIPKLTGVLLNHVVGATAYSVSLSNGQRIPTLGADDVIVAINGGGVSINGSGVATADVSVTNGVVHIVDTVIYDYDDGEPNGAATLVPSLMALCILIVGLLKL